MKKCLAVLTICVLCIPLTAQAGERVDQLRYYANPQVYDADGQYLGMLLDLGDHYTVYIDALKVVARIDTRGRLPEGSVYFAGLDCTGQVFLNRAQTHVALRSWGITYVGTQNVNDSIPLLSRTGAPDGCVNEANTTSQSWVYAEKVELPFTVPVAMPLAFH